MAGRSEIHGLIAEFEELEDLVRAVRIARREGYRHMDAYSPFPNDELAEAMELGKTAVAPIVLLGGIFGGAGGFFMMWFANVIHYPINVGGRPYNSWPAFIPITFELTVLLAALAALGAMLVLNKLPMPYHPVFNVPDFERASTDRFFLCIEANDHKFNLSGTRTFLETLHPRLVLEVPA